MTDLIDSLLEFSRTRESLRPTHGNLVDTVDHVVQAIKGRPEFHQVRMEVVHKGRAEGWFDRKKLERALYNLLLNACEAMPGNSGEITVALQETEQGVEILVSDNGRGIPEAIRDRLFQPFVSYGKENGTGLGLTVVQKIIQDHGGDVAVEKTSPEGTVFKLILPLMPVGFQENYSANVDSPALTRVKPAKTE